jgi:hypothetical protein
VLDDFRAAIRSFRHRRGMALTVVVTLALGIGANTAIFSAVDAALVKPLPYPAADRLVLVYELNRGQRQATQLVTPTSEVFNVPPRDPLTFPDVPIVLAFVAAVAALVPVRRATPVDPMQVLRDE